MIAQLDLFAVLDRPSAPAPAPVIASPDPRNWPLPASTAEALLPGQVRGTGVHGSDERPYWKTRAFSWNGEILAYAGNPEPLEMAVRGVPTVIAFGFGFSTHAIEAPGSPYWSETGFRSFTCCSTRDADEIRAIIEAYIDAPAKDGNGLGGRLAPWWTSEVRMWMQEARFLKGINPDFWQHKGEVEGARIYAAKVAHVAELLQRVIEQGIDPHQVAPDLAPRQAALL